jgi:hypothetical protein
VKEILILHLLSKKHIRHSESDCYGRRTVAPETNHHFFDHHQAKHELLLEMAFDIQPQRMMKAIDHTKRQISILNI